MSDRYSIVEHSIVELAAWPGSGKALDAAVSAARSRGDTVLSIAPRRFWLINGDYLPAGSELAVTDLSDGYRCLRVFAGDRRDLLAGGLPVNLDPARFPAGAVATSAIETITVTVHNRGDAFDVYCGRSYVDSLAEWLQSAVTDYAESSRGEA